MVQLPTQQQHAGLMYYLNGPLVQFGFIHEILKKPYTIFFLNLTQ